MVKNYLEDFSSWEDVQEQYEMKEEEPDDVYYADYTYEHYEGDSTVIYRRGSKFYIVTGGHCSCYGLEGQWEPEEFSSFDEFVRYCSRVGGLYWTVIEDNFDVRKAE